MGALKNHQQIDLFPELVIEHRAHQFKKIRNEIEEVQKQEEDKENAQRLSIRYSDKPKGLEILRSVNKQFASTLPA